MPPYKGTVLIVDDEPQVLSLCAQVIGIMGYSVIEASSGPEALEKSAGSSSYIDLLLTDLIMPGMTGRALADTLKAWFPGLQVVFMSGHIEDSRLVTARGLHYIQKPFEPRKLGELVNRLVRKKKIWA